MPPPCPCQSPTTTSTRRIRPSQTPTGVSDSSPLFVKPNEPPQMRGSRLGGSHRGVAEGRGVGSEIDCAQRAGGSHRDVNAKAPAGLLVERTHRSVARVEDCLGYRRNAAKGRARQRRPQRPAVLTGRDPGRASEIPLESARTAMCEPCEDRCVDRGRSGRQTPPRRGRRRTSAEVGRHDDTGLRCHWAWFLQPPFDRYGVCVNHRRGHTRLPGKGHSPHRPSCTDSVSHRKLIRKLALSHR